MKWFIKRDLLGEEVDLSKHLWKLPEVDNIFKKQQENGSWRYPGKLESMRTTENYAQLETYRQLGFLIELYALNNNHARVSKACGFLFNFQTQEGDFRGIYGNQFSPNYSAGIMELLIKAGYENDERIQEGLEWLLSVRQSDGGWAIPIRSHNKSWKEVVDSEVVLHPKRKKPFSHMATGVVLRAFAAHPEYRNKLEIKNAGKLLASRFFENDKYPDRKDKTFWTKFTFPFWFTDLLSSLDSLSYLGFMRKDPAVRKALNWFIDNQLENGSWNLKLLKGGKVKDYPSWINFIVCRTLKRFFT